MVSESSQVYTTRQWSQNRNLFCSFGWTHISLGLQGPVQRKLKELSEFCQEWQKTSKVCPHSRFGSSLSPLWICSCFPAVEDFLKFLVTTGGRSQIPEHTQDIFEWKWRHSQHSILWEGELSGVLSGKHTFPACNDFRQLQLVDITMLPLHAGKKSFPTPTHPRAHSHFEFFYLVCHLWREVKIEPRWKYYTLKTGKNSVVNNKRAINFARNTCGLICQWIWTSFALSQSIYLVYPQVLLYSFVRLNIFRIACGLNKINWPLPF